MKNSKAQELIKKILDDLDYSGIITNTLVKDLQTLRPYAVEEKEPVIAKAIRLTYEHIQAYETFAVLIPEDEPIEGLEEEDVEPQEAEPTKPKENLAYLISLMKDAGNKRNLEEIREFNATLIAYAEEN